MTRELLLTNGLITLVDDEDYDWLVQWDWSAHKSRTYYYASRSIPQGRGMKDKKMRMHVQIMNPPAGMVVDHINHDTLDNRRSNLRVCTNQQNIQGKSGHAKLYGTLKGAHYDKSSGMWMAHIGVNYKKYHLGRFLTEYDAALAYDSAARDAFGEYANVNFKDGPSVEYRKHHSGFGS